jgi:superfamily II DNA or RNA helicase
MELNERKSAIQDEAVLKWSTNNKIGTAEIITGLGKTFLALKALYTMPKHDLDTVHLFLAEQRDREVDFLKDVAKFNEIFKRDVFKDYNVQFHCYQTVRNWKDYKLGLVICDEIHDSMSIENYKFYLNNEYKAILGLTALFKGDLIYWVPENHDLHKSFGKGSVSKQEMLDKIAPIVYKYNTNQGQKEGTSRKLNIYKINMELDNKSKTIQAGSKEKPFYQTEAAAYSYIEKKYNEISQMTQSLLEDFYKFQERKNLQLYKIINKRCKILYELTSKVVAVKVMLSIIDGKTVIFGNSLDKLLSITKNVVSSKNSEQENNSIRKSFDEGSIKVIGSFKKLIQGANLKEVDNCIIMSYYSTEVKFIQMIGRLRQNANKEGNVFILITKGTQEEIWANKMLENSTEYNIIECEGTADAMSKYRNNNLK